ncbi:unnamed protein product [Acanthoscelides obtectus]|uniref:Uncharacterized protein n=2 Tax=Acanthoscelides obtectus TaxID=200917 RepID=A0A9P0P3B4_ACAOB|nr:unnamed protein product [Acanthoscelides obtectus]CAK1655533.1 hypothetical protein AOBTE_LOCUS19208 [Acanthoscelides obtectus]
MNSKRDSKKRKLQALLEDLLDSASESDASQHPESIQNEETPGLDEEDEEMNIPIAHLGTGEKPVNPLIALLEGKGSNLNNGPAVHEDIQQLLTLFIAKGLDNDTRKEAIDSFPLLKGCTALNPPELNAEIKICLNSAVLRQDAFLVKIQNQLAAIISALAVQFNELYKDSKSNPSQPTEEVLKKAGDPLKLVADTFHSISCHRRYLIVPSLDSSIKDILEACPVDSLLFGVEFPEKWKMSKEAKRLGACLKKKPNKILRTGPSFSTQSMAVTGPSSSTPRSRTYQTRNKSPFLPSSRSPARSRYKKEHEEVRRYPPQKRR